MLAGKVAVVTGGAAGIGAGVARLLAAHGADVAVVDVEADGAARTVRDVEAAGGRARAWTCDVRDGAAVAALATDVLAAHERVDVLVNNVGHYLESVPFSRSDPEHWDALYRVNLHHVFLVTRAFVPSMIQRKSGSIINVSSVEGLRGYPPDPVYGAFKAAVVHFTSCLAVELGRRGVRVNGIAPDLTQTPQVDYSKSVAPEEEKMWESWAPVGRVGVPEDQAEVVLFLASDRSRFVTGHTIPTDGGTLAGGGWFWSPNRRRWTNRPRDP
ncbi:MAG: SDR family oxidoreductase [Deltaproteobacteria bacterium]|nr:SDR family oxidoreductase [Deltaproteobacteria bacterium]